MGQCWSEKGATLAHPSRHTGSWLRRWLLVTGLVMGHLHHCSERLCPRAKQPWCGSDPLAPAGESQSSSSSKPLANNYIMPASRVWGFLLCTAGSNLISC